MNAAARLREAGLRVTAPRVAVFEAVVAVRHADAVCRTMPGTSVQAVYDNLAGLTGAGLLRRIEPVGHPARSEARVGDNHHHLVCRRCGRTEDVDCVVGVSPCLAAGEAHGFTIDEAEVTFWGLCPECADKRQPSPTIADPCPEGLGKGRQSSAT